jgi:acetoin utilization deacetylase AcuC-like enzyme
MPLPVISHPGYAVDIGPHVFPMEKYRLVRERLLAEGTIAAGDLVQPEPVADDDVRLVHTAEFVRKIRDGRLSVAEQLTLEVPYFPALRDVMWLMTGGTMLAARLAIERQIAVHLGGGFHHAFPDHGEGFCLVNDVAIAIRMLARHGLARRALVVDLDVHHGNGTAAIFRDEPAVFTFSMHQERNYPAWKPPSDLDVGLDDRTPDASYLAALERHLPDIVERHRPEIAFYLAGADPFEHDQLGGLALSMDGLRRRDATVFRTLREGAVPVAVVLAGGYSVRQDDTVEIHCNTVRVAAGTR